MNVVFLILLLSIIFSSLILFLVESLIFGNVVLYSQLISQDCQNKFKGICIPGNNISDNIYIKNYYLIEKHLNTLAPNEGAYVCGCGLYYDIGPCGFPTKNGRGICANCGKNIGYDKLPSGIKGTHGFAHVEGHYRIFKDLETKEQQFKKYKDNDQNIPNKLLAEYKKDTIDPILEKEKYGICKVSKITFEDIHQK
jgi:hypothetical protein